MHLSHTRQNRHATTKAVKSKQERTTYPTVGIAPAATVAAQAVGQTEAGASSAGTEESPRPRWPESVAEARRGARAAVCSDTSSGTGR